MLIFHYISYKFDKISHLKNQIWHWKISILPDLTSQNQHFSEKSADLAPLPKFKNFSDSRKAVYRRENSRK